MKYFSILVLVFSLLACNDRNINSIDKKITETFDEKSLLENLEQNTLKSIKEEFRKRGISNLYKCKKVTLVHKSGNEYAGVVETKYLGNELSLPVEVVYDGTNLVWQLKK